jgi:dipeptidyl aminopeptidase/acylaminoacyl peptidase
MGLVSENEEGYEKSSVLTYAARFPNEPDRLLIAHGLIDENVHFRNTEVLVKRLIQEGKPHRVQGK